MITVLLNTASGAGRRPGAHEDLASLLSTAGLDATIDEIVDPLTIPRAARSALSRGSDAVVAAGGDGTVSSVASVLAGTSVPLGVLPLGTLNHFARDAGIPTELSQAVQVLAEGRVRRVDVALVNERVFVNNCSIGVYPDVIEVRERLRARGYPKWIAMMRATVEVIRRDDAVSIRMASGDASLVARTPFVFIGNNEYLVEGIHVGARCRLDTGRLVAYFAPPIRRRDLPKMAASAILRLRSRVHRLRSIAGVELWIDALRSPELPLACDGELLTLATPLRFRAWPAALTLLAAE